MSNVSESIRRRGGKSKWGSSLSFFPHIIYYPHNLAKRNLNKGIKGGRFGHFLLQFSLSLGSDFSPPTFNLCPYRTCKSLHERGFKVLPQGKLQGRVVVFQTIKVLTTPNQRRWGLSRSFRNIMLSTLGSLHCLGDWELINSTIE
jgi:hypothetical protein